MTVAKTVHLWRIGTDTPDFQADDMTGKGAQTTGGRWNRIGTPVVYAASNIALATLETLVHFDTMDLPINRILVRLDVPGDLWAARKVMTAATAPVGWEVQPAGMVSLNTGEAWLAAGQEALFEVPSAIVPEESNVLVNPRHPDSRRIGVVRTRVFRYDARLKPVAARAAGRRP
jgi:RES domain-containing protein